MKKIFRMITGRLKYIALSILLVISLSDFRIFSQAPAESEIRELATNFTKSYFPAGEWSVGSITSLDSDGTVLLYVAEIEPEGWLLISGDKRAEAVLGFSESGDYLYPENIPGHPSAAWLDSYRSQIRFAMSDEDAPESRAWREMDFPDIDAKNVDYITIKPLIKAMWNQGAGWNQFCPYDYDGPGQHVLVGCVAVAMAQAMSVYKTPATGIGTHSYNHTEYGVLTVDYAGSEYRWDDMSDTDPDEENAKLLYHCAVSVNMNFGPDGSSASTSNTPAAMEEHFGFSRQMIYEKRDMYSADGWKNLMIEQLMRGRPIIYRGENADASSAHAFNIDGVKISLYFSLNWGWGGSNNGYYQLTALTPGTRNYTYDNAAVINIQPYYYPTGVSLSNSIVPEDEAAGALIGNYQVIDEAEDNEYTVVLVCDSTYIDGAWVMDYYIDGSLVKTGRTFVTGDMTRDTVWFVVTDTHGNLIEVEKELLFSKALGTDDAWDENNDGPVIYPNPAGRYFVITAGDASTPHMARIFSLSGEMVLSVNNPRPDAPVDISNLAEGLYIVEVTYTDGRVSRRKLIKN